MCIRDRLGVEAELTDGGCGAAIAAAGLSAAKGFDGSVGDCETGAAAGEQAARETRAKASGA